MGVSPYRVAYMAMESSRHGVYLSHPKAFIFRMNSLRDLGNGQGTNNIRRKKYMKYALWAAREVMECVFAPWGLVSAVQHHNKPIAP